MFSLFPQSNSSGTFQKVTQVIPVKISIDDLQGLNLVPGMNVTVKIHKNGLTAAATGCLTGPGERVAAQQHRPGADRPLGDRLRRPARHTRTAWSRPPAASTRPSAVQASRREP